MFSAEKDPAWKNWRAGWEKVKALDMQANRIVWLEPGPANNTWAIDGPVAELGLVVLEDTRGVQPIYAPAPIVRADVLARHPKIADLLAPVFRTLDTTTLQSLNARIAIGGEDARKVAASHLKAKGLVK
jgi:glycine betaine/choline ABC-type transport system substrate-binding protein